MRATRLAGGLLIGVLGLAGFAAVVEPRDDRESVVAGNTAFGLDLYGQVREKEGNLFLSPYSVSTALAMTYAGARTDTATQMAQTLHFTLSPEKLHPAFAKLQRETAGKPDDKRPYQLSVANALWGQQGHPWRDEFLTLTKEHYGAGLREVNFAGETEKARQTINGWVERQTQDKIKDLLKKEHLSPSTRLVLTNAIYFKGDWAAQFKKADTKPGSFVVSAERKVEAPLMHRTGAYRFAKDDQCQALELPYKGNDLAMVVLLPKKVDGLPAFEKQLTPKRLAGILGGLVDAPEVNVTLPKFKFTADFELRDALGKLGMTDAFAPGKADFSGLDGRRSLCLGAVVHKAFVEVNEEGTEAAAATAVVTIDPGKPEVVNFRADHPFLFLVRDRRSGSALFLGRVSDPSR